MESNNTNSKACFLNGHLILREHKTGVHIFHEKMTKCLLKLHTKYGIDVAFFDKNKQHEGLLSNDENAWLRDNTVICRSWPRILSYLLPIEIFFGKHDVYFCDGLFPHCFFKSKRICLVHDLMVKIYPENYSLIKKIYLELFFSKLKKADAVVCVSETTKKDIIKYYGISPEKIFVCYNGVDEKKPVDSMHISDETIDLEKKYLFYVGDMRINKNLKNAILGFLHYCEQNSVNDLYFYIAGKKGGEYEELLKILENSSHRDQVVFLGYISDNDKELLYANSAAVVLVSFYEGFGMPIIEGMQHGRPVITSNCSSMQEIGSNAAILVDPHNPESIANGIAIVNSGNYSIDINCYEECLEKYTFENVSRIVDKVIEKIL